MRVSERKPLLILPPAPEHWPALERLLIEGGCASVDDLRARFADGIDGARDACAVVRDGSRKIACVVLRRRHDVGLLGPILTTREHRLRGHAHRLMQTLLSWFDMTGGKWLYAFATPALYPALFEPFGFQVLHRAERPADTASQPLPSQTASGPMDPPQARAVEGGAPEPGRRPPDPEPLEVRADANEAAGDVVAQVHDTTRDAGMLSLLRMPSSVRDNPVAAVTGEPIVGELSRADLPLLVALLQHRPGPDARVSRAESALGAEVTALELIGRAARGTCLLLGVWRGPQVVAVGSLAVDPLGSRSYAMMFPDQPQPATTLRDALLERARARGYEQVDFPLELLAAT
jgi:GNAT superfamily N-acetyltransferase